MSDFRLLIARVATILLVARVTGWLFGRIGQPRVIGEMVAETVVLLLPVYFAFTGLRSSFGLVASGSMALSTALIIAVAVAGKWGGALAAARAARLSWRESAAVGVLINTRGLVGLIILNIGIDLGVLSPALFSAMVLMALVTTFMTSPLLGWILPREAEKPSA